MKTLRPLVIALLLGIGLSLTSCGGGGGGGTTPPPGTPNALLSGSYFAWVMAAEDDAGGDIGITTWGTLVADGAGGLTGSVTENEGGIVSGPVPTPALAYAIAADRATTLTSGGTETYEGWTNASGTLTTLASTTAGEPPAMLAFLKLGSGITNADLAGDYHLLGLSLTPGGSTLSAWGSATFDAVGAGNYSFAAPGAVNLEGAVSSGTGSTLAYTLASDGSFTWTLAGSTPFEAALLEGGEMFVAIGATSGGETSVFVGIRKTAGATAATLDGDYQLIGLERDGGGFSSLTGTIAADGVSAFSATFSKNSDGVLSTSGPDAGTYSVAADGRTVITGGDPLEGGVAASGNVACVAGPTTSGSPGLYLFFRR
jgi:hypothetical protein